jgi:hypothetical protein
MTPSAYLLEIKTKLAGSPAVVSVTVVEVKPGRSLNILNLN